VKFQKRIFDTLKSGLTVSELLFVRLSYPLDHYCCLWYFICNCDKIQVREISQQWHSVTNKNISSKPTAVTFNFMSNNRPC